MDIKNKQMSKLEMYRIIGVVGKITLPTRSMDNIQTDLGVDLYNAISIQAMKNNSYQVENYFYDYFLNKEDYISINKYFQVAFGFSNRQTVTICDLFAGKGDWLSSFKDYVPNEKLGSGKLHLIGNESQIDEFNSMNSLIEDVTNQPLEKFQSVPKNSVSLMLYNANNNATHSLEYFLNMIIEKQLIHNSKGTQGINSGKIVIVASKQDLVDNLSLIVGNFDIHKHCVYTIQTGELVLYATLKNDPIEITQSNIQPLEKIISKEPRFNASMYSLWGGKLPHISYKEMKENFAIVKDNQCHISDMSNDNWSWIKGITKVEDTSLEKMTKPTDLKLGEMANIIASGMINGEMSLDGKGRHIVTGGTRSQSKEEYFNKENKKGEIEGHMRTIIYSEPYLNILVSENGKVKIKELFGEGELM